MRAMGFMDYKIEASTSKFLFKFCLLLSLFSRSACVVSYALLLVAFYI